VDVRWRNPDDPGGKPHALARLVTRLPRGYVIDTSALRTMSVRGEPKVRDGRAWGRLPPTCPGRGTTSMEFVNRDGVAQTVDTRTRREPPAEPLRLRVSGVPRGTCVSRPFRARARVVSQVDRVRAELLLDGRFVHRTRRVRFSKRIDRSVLARDRHGLTLRARDAAGRTAQRTAAFGVCGE
jgi:hypothetical protein